MKLIKYLKRIILIIVISASLINPVFSYYFTFYPGRDINSELVTVTGDSYAGYFAAFECLKDFSFLIYADAGKSTEENYRMMKEAIKSISKVIIISIGVNDHNKNITPIAFRSRMEEFVMECEERGKKVILHTYMNYDETAFGDKYHIVEVKEYDDILKDIAKKYSNVIYIDMSDYNQEEYLQIDRIHYNKEFYDVLYNRICTALMLLP